MTASPDEHLIVLTCAHCGEECLHEVRYAGRLIASTTCSECGYTVQHEVHDLRHRYVRDLEHRLITKPLRMLRRAGNDPWGFARTLPGSLARKPARLYDELRPLFRRR